MKNESKPLSDGLDDIYNMTLGEYVKRHNTSVSDMILKTELDIEILRESLELKKLDGLNTPIFNTVYIIYTKKKEHLERLKEWDMASKKRLILLFGGTCVGKSTLESKIVEEFGVKRLRLHTTRSPRSCDTPNYHFHADWDSFMKSAREIPLDLFYHTGLNDSYYGYVLPEEDGVYITTFLQEEYAAILEAIAIKQGFSVDVHVMTCTPEETLKCFMDRGMDDGEAERRSALNQRPCVDLFKAKINTWKRGVGPKKRFSSHF